MTTTTFALWCDATQGDLASALAKSAAAETPTTVTVSLQVLAIPVTSTVLATRPSTEHGLVGTADITATTSSSTWTPTT